MGYLDYQGLYTRKSALQANSQLLVIKIVITTILKYPAAVG